MTTRQRDTLSPALQVVERVGLSLPGVERATRYNGAMVLKVDGVFLASTATHPSAEPDSLVVKVDLDDRSSLLEEAAQTYYVTDYYRPHPVVLVRLAHIDAESLRDLLSMAMRFVSRRTARAKRHA